VVDRIQGPASKIVPYHERNNWLSIANQARTIVRWFEVDTLLNVQITLGLALTYESLVSQTPCLELIAREI
jgi:hypothetical protein